MHNPRVIISVLNWQQYRETIQCIQSLQMIDYDNYEIIIVDNNSPNDSYDQLVRAFPDIRIIKSTVNGGYAAGHKIVSDIAIRENAELFWVLNNDLTVRPDALTELVSAYELYGVAIYGSVTLMAENPDIINYGGGEDVSYELKEWSHDLFNNTPYSEEYKLMKVRNVQAIDGCSMLLPTALVKEYGYIDTSWFMYGEETDYCFTMRKKGIPTYVVCRSAVLHKGSGSFKTEPNLSVISTYYRRRNYIRFQRKHFSLSILDSIKLCGGSWNLIKFFIKYYVSSSDYRLKAKTEYYLNVGSLHGVFGVKGKVISPEQFLSES